MYESIKAEAKASAEEIIKVGNLKEGQILVVGCSTSEICGSKIGSNSNPEVAEAAFAGIHEACIEHSVFLAAQCCEHLNRAIIIEKDAVPFKDIVNVVPQPKAGGSFATAAYKSFNNPVAVEEITADAGIDIGGTLIGMHIRKVCVPVRLTNNHIGDAFVAGARSRARFIGGSRAIYDESML